eukprot:425816-Pelagomonas_calceolata.AAC.1
MGCTPTGTMLALAPVLKLSEKADMARSLSVWMPASQNDSSSRAYKGYKGLQGNKRPQSRRLTASLFMNTHEVMKEKRKASCGRRGGVEKRSFAQKVRHTFDGESRPGDWSI